MLAKVDNSIDLLEATCGAIRKLIIKNPNQQQNLLTLVYSLLYSPLFFTSPPMFEIKDKIALTY